MATKIEDQNFPKWRYTLTAILSHLLYLVSKISNREARLIGCEALEWSGCCTNRFNPYWSKFKGLWFNERGDKEGSGLTIIG